MNAIAKETSYKPILFSPKMVRAILKKQKTQTRRAVKGTSLKPKAEVGDVFWVRETFSEKGERLIFRADVCSKHDLPDGFKWKPSIFMRKELCRVFLEITDVKYERLTDISENDAIKEGIPNGAYAVSPIGSFQELWESINGKDSWSEETWVWVYSFKIIEKPNSFN